MSSVPGSGRSLEEGMATHCSILAWKIPWTEEPGRLQYIGLQRVRHDCAGNTFTFVESTALENGQYGKNSASNQFLFLSFKEGFGKVQQIQQVPVLEEPREQTPSRQRQDPGNQVRGAAGSLGAGAGSVWPCRVSGWEPETQ